MSKSKADDAASGEKGDADKPKKKKFFKSKKFLIIFVVFLLVGGGGAYKFMAPPAKAAPPAGGDIVVMDPNTVNLKDGHYLQVAISIQLLKGGDATLDDFQDSKAAQLLIDEFSNRSMKGLSNKQRAKLMKQLTFRIKKAYPHEVYDVFVTKFVTQ